MDNGYGIQEGVPCTRIGFLSVVHHLGALCVCVCVWCGCVWCVCVWVGGVCVWVVCVCVCVCVCV